VITVTRWSPLKAPERQTIGQLATLAEVQAENRRLYRAFLLGEGLRLPYGVSLLLMRWRFQSKPKRKAA
jgi:hypothetical protein